MVQKYRLWYTNPISIRSVIIRRLCELGYPVAVANDVIDAVHESKSILSGPFMLAVLVTPLDELLRWPVGWCWFPENVDVYTNKHSSDKIYPSRMVENAYSHASNYIPDWDAINDGSIRFLRPYVEEIIFESQIDDLAGKLFDSHDFDFFKIAYDGHTLLIKDLNSVINMAGSFFNCINCIKSIEFDYYVMVFKGIKNINQTAMTEYRSRIINCANESNYSPFHMMECDVCGINRKTDKLCD
jgi:hypothetical protein